MLTLRPTPLDHPDAAALIVLLQAYYRGDLRRARRHAARRGRVRPPAGYFVVGYVDGVAVACGGWRARDVDDPPLRPGDAEIKRMFVHPAHRGRGVARAVLADLETAAGRAGRRRMVLETGVRQPEAIGLYVSAGYVPMAPFGTYRDAEGGRYYSKSLPGAIARRWRMIRITHDEVRGPDMLVAATDLRLDTTWIDYVLVAFYFVLVLGIGVLARRSVSSSLDFLLSGRSLPAWVTGLAFISANLGAIELIGMTANGAQYGLPTVHYYWIGAVPAMVFLGIVMMPFYYGSKARSVPEFLQKRFNHTTQRVNAVTFALSSVLIAGVNLFALGLVMEALLGWSLWWRSRWPRWWC